MRNNEMSRTQVQVGVTAEARQMNCTDEEARILLRNRMRASGSQPVRKALGPVGAVLEVLLFNRSAALFYGTIGYWTFGAFLFMATSGGDYPDLSVGIRPVDMLIANPLIMLGLSFALLIIGLSGGGQETWYSNALYGPLAMLAVAPSIVISYLLSVIFIPILALTIPFGIAWGGDVSVGMVVMFLIPIGYALPFKMADELG